MELLTPAEWSAVVLSLQVAGLALLVGLPLALMAAYLLAYTRFPGHALVTGLFHLPLVLPPVVTGYALLILFGKTGPVRSFLHETFGNGLQANGFHPKPLSTAAELDRFDGRSAYVNTQIMGLLFESYQC